MQPGIYDISNADYHASDGISRSGISELLRSPLHYWDIYLNQDREAKATTPQMLLGETVHTLVLEPKTFNERFYVGKKPRLNTKSGKAEYQAYLEASSGKTVIPDELLAKALKMRDSVLHHPVASQFLNGEIEKSIYWTDEETGVLCKARPDIWHEKVIFDLKTAASADSKHFSRAIFDNNYHIQAAMCLDAVASTGKPYHANFGFIVVESARPFVTALYILNDDAIDLGRQEYKEALKVFKQCKESNLWPGYSFEVQDIGLPRYAFI